jgi:hypothetical protein
VEVISAADPVAVFRDIDNQGVLIQPWHRCTRTMNLPCPTIFRPRWTFVVDETKPVAKRNHKRKVTLTEYPRPEISC